MSVARILLTAGESTKERKRYERAARLRSAAG